MPKVLVVDDSALMRRLITGVLSTAGYEVQAAHNGSEGVEKLVQWQPDVVTLDINMPQMDGLTALSLIMAARPTPVVMVSSLTEDARCPPSRPWPWARWTSSPSPAAPSP